MAGKTSVGGCVAQVFFYSAAFVVYSAFRSSSLGSGLSLSTEDILIAGSIAAILATIGSFILKQQKQEDQKQRNNDAKKIYEKILTNQHHEDFALFLRSFRLTENLSVKNRKYQSIPLSPAHFREEELINIETTLSELCEGIGSLIALGKPSNIIGFGKLSTDDIQWEVIVKKLMNRAKVIFIFPGNTGGIRREIQMIKDLKLNEKVIYILPPELNYNDKIYDEIRNEMGRFNLDFPQINNSGCLFTLNLEGELRETTKFDFINAKHFKKKVHKMIVNNRSVV